MFFFIRAGLALIPSIASRHPIKKWAAAAALVAATFYLMLSGAEVATQRSFIMIAIVLVGVMVDRPTLTFRTLTVAAFGVLLLAAGIGRASELPDVVCGDARADRGLSIRTALARQGRHIARCARGAMGWARDRRAYPGFAGRRPGNDALCRLSLPPRRALRCDCQFARHAGGVREVMPMGILGVLAMPFGFDAVFWKLMGVRHRLDDLGGAMGDQPAGRGRPCAGVRDRAAAARHGGDPAAVPAAHAAALERGRAGDCRQPMGDVGAAARCAGRRRRADRRPSAAAMAGLQYCTAVATVSRSRNGSPPTPMRAPSRMRRLHDGVQCDAAGCIGRLTDGRLVSFALSVEAFAEDCARAAVVVSAAPGAGRLRRVLDRPQCWRAHGALALRWTGDRFELSAARPIGPPAAMGGGPLDVERKCTGATSSGRIRRDAEG